MPTYPVFLTNLDRRRAAVFGDGAAAAKKVLELAEAGFGHVDAISPTPSPELIATARHPAVALHVRRHGAHDLEGTTLAIATDRDQALNAWLHDEAQSTGVLAVATDDVPHCTAFGGAQIRRGRLAIAIGTGGAAPAVAVRLREAIERALPDETEALLELAADLRPWIADAIPSFARRRDAWYAVVDDAALRAHLAAGRSCAARGRAITIVLEYAEGAEPEPAIDTRHADAPQEMALAGAGGEL